MSSTPQLHPAATATVPMHSAASAPPSVSDRAPQAAPATAAATNPPIVARVKRGINLGAIMASSVSPAVDPLVPLTLLETVRDLDRPVGAAEAEYVPELLNKRLGMTDTVFAQIRRYATAVERGERVRNDEVAALSRLLARRPDASVVFQTAGERIATVAYQRLSSVRRGMIRYSPRFIARPIARRQARRIENRYFRAPVETAYHDAGMRALHLLLRLD